MPMRNLSSQQGYSLIEMMVSVALFSLVMLLATGAFIKFMALEKVARYTNDVTNNLTFAVDSMTRAMRTGTDYQCGGEGQGPNCWPTSRDELSFTDDRGRLVTYLVKEDGALGRCTDSGCTETNATSLTDNRIFIEEMRFFVQGVGTTSPNTGVQPRVLVNIRGQMTPDPDRPPVDFTIQSSATQRLLDI